MSAADLSMMDKIATMRDRSAEQASARENYAKFLVFQRDENGWTPDEIADYKAKISVLMGKDDAAVLALFPDGLYRTAEDARMATRNFWRTWREDMRV